MMMFFCTSSSSSRHADPLTVAAARAPAVGQQLMHKNPQAVGAVCGAEVRDDNGLTSQPVCVLLLHAYARAAP